MPQPPHVWAPHELIDPDHLAAYQAYKRNSTGELRDVDLHLPVDVLWFHRFQSNFMELEDTHMDAYLKILRKRQRAFPTVYGSRINILDSQFYSWLCNYWDRKMGSGSDRPRTGWSSQKQKWSEEDLTVVRGQLPLGNFPWHNVDSVLIPCNLGHRVPQQDTGGNCGAHTLKVTEYLAANRDTFDWCACFCYPFVCSSSGCFSDSLGALVESWFVVSWPFMVCE
ncbi:hypothetical protein LWI29_004856 [Acer saccharum]|uniref:Uncharacterized protein n=1 Tax=Acer saccharum TaxID=4024 RepID=A0AA39RC12_ACESA|nr:hypothetical protein LWI29_004856 [Acer saccharum]